LLSARAVMLPALASARVRRFRMIAHVVRAARVAPGVRRRIECNRKQRQAQSQSTHIAELSDGMRFRLAPIGIASRSA
jgi:hypothetical protein